MGVRLHLSRLSPAAALLAISCSPAVKDGAKGNPEPAWSPLPLIVDGKVSADWQQIGWGGFAVEDGSLRTECDPRGLGLLVYAKEKLGNCQVRVVFRTQHAKSNAGVIVRLDGGVLDHVGRPGAAFDRSGGGISDASRKSMMESSEREEGPWFAVHRGYEVQIMDAADGFHRTGAIYSLAPSSSVPERPAGEWRTMVITLAGRRIDVEVDGTRVTTFDPDSPGVPPRKEWYEPKREPVRPEVGHIGLQNHDPGDVVWFREVSVRPLPVQGAR